MWNPVDRQFYVPRLPIGIVALPGQNQSAAMREYLELLDCVVAVHWIGTPTDFLHAIAQGDQAPRYLIINGHGAEEGFYFGDFISSIDTSMLDGEYLPDKVVREHANLPGCTLLALTCKGGRKSLAQAFLSGRTAGYIGCGIENDGVATTVFMINFFYNVISKGLSDRDAWKRAVATTDHDDIYAMRYFHADGQEEQFGRE